MHGLNMYDYSARYMDPAIGRFTTVDPHAENYYSWSPYHYAGNNPIRITDPTGMDWYRDDKGNTFWQEGSEKTVTRTYTGEDGNDFITINYRNIGESYTTYTGGVMVRYEQNVADVYYFDEDMKATFYEPQTLKQGKEPSFFEEMSASTNIFTQMGYNILNDVYVTLQPLTFGLIGESRVNEFTGNVAFENLDGTTNYRGDLSGANTFATIFTLGAGSTGQAPKGIALSKLNCAQFSHTFKGSLSALPPATRGLLNRNLNKGISVINFGINQLPTAITYTNVNK